MKLVWVRHAGLPYPLVNQPVFDLSGNLMGIADLFDPQLGVVGEYDGAAHKARERHRRDVARETEISRRADSSTSPWWAGTWPTPRSSCRGCSLHEPGLGTAAHSPASGL